MQRILAKSGALLLGMGLLVGQALAVLPDPVAFGWAVERGDVAKVRAWLDEGLRPEFQGQQIVAPD